MRRYLNFGFVVVLCANCALALAQGGTTGGGGFGGGGGSFGGAGAGEQGGGQGGNPGQRRYDDDVRRIELGIGNYLSSQGIKNILTPGEFSQWKLTMKNGQVLIADATSEVFDPALQVVKLKEGDDEEAPGTVLTENDDRYPGDQRPLLIWHCDEDGEYMLRARCFRDKSGGQFTLRMQTYDSFDLSSDSTNDLTLDGQRAVLLRLRMKAGEIERISIEIPSGEQYSWAILTTTISPTGLPDIDLTGPLDRVLAGSVMAAVDGDYYSVAQTSAEKGKKLRVRTESTDIKEMASDGDGKRATAKVREISLWKFAVKKGEVLRVVADGVYPYLGMAYSEMPDVSKFSIEATLEEGKTNPFFPRVAKEGEDPDQAALQGLEARARDNRVRVFAALRDSTVWLASDGAGPTNTEYAVTIRAAAARLEASNQFSGTLGIGHTEYWDFDAKAGDVMTFASQIQGFAGSISVLDPDLDVAWDDEAEPDQMNMSWNLIVNKPGKYLVSVAAIGDGGGGTYSIKRDELSAREFSRGKPASGNFSTGQAEVWKFSAEPGSPLYVHWKSSASDYTVSIIDEQGRPLELDLTPVDEINQFGILTVLEKTTFVIVLVSRGKESAYSITLSDLPGYVKGG